MHIYFVRHAQSMGNMGGEYDMSFAGKLSDDGYRQAEHLAGRLENYQFDDIFVSPLERTVLTILPFLKKTGRIAEIWPGLVESRGNKKVYVDPPPHIRHGDPVELSEEARPCFKMRKDDDGTHLPPADETYWEGQRRAVRAGARILGLYDGTEKSVLVIGHACSGSRLLETLMKIPMDGRFSHRNTGISYIKQKENGDFVMPFSNRVSETDETAQ